MAMMNDEQSSADRLAQGSGYSDLDGSRDGQAGTYHGAYAGDAAAPAGPGLDEGATVHIGGPPPTDSGDGQPTSGEPPAGSPQPTSLTPASPRVGGGTGRRGASCPF